jgi:selenide, water dikinase
MPARLTENVKAGGCASKLNPKILDAALKSVPQRVDDRVLVGYDTADDAGVYEITEAAKCPLALVQTVDFFTPIVDDAYAFGAIAAANALSDIYAMGGRPLTALSLLVYPERGDMADLEAMLRGGANKIHQAECVIVGGHSIAEEQVKLGYAVTGLVDPQRIWKNSGARPGDVLVFTKKIGTGVISTALKKGIVQEEHMAASIAQMLILNRQAADAMSDLNVHGCTDVTGFGLLGHAREMALASNVTLQISASRMQFLPGAIEYAKAGAHSSGLKNNREFVSDCVSMAGVVPSEIEALLYDPQTSGGLLASLSEKDAEVMLTRRPEAHLVGRVTERTRKPIEVLI